MSLNVSIIVELGHFQKDLVKNTRKRGPSGKHFGAFSSIYSQNYILNGKFNPKMDTIRTFISKIRTFSIFKISREVLPSHSICMPLIVAEYALVSLSNGLVVKVLDS